jgi:two-component system response regulator
MTTILLVEDNPADVLLTADGEEALDYLYHRGRFQGLEPDDAPAIVLLDLKLPKVDGLEVLRAIRTHPKLGLLPVIVLTSSMEDQDLARSYELGANSYIQKPVDFKEFMQKVAQLGLYWLMLNEAPPQGRRE